MICDLCPEAAVAVAPGDEPIDLGDVVLPLRGVARRQWCARCWPWRPAERAA